MIAIRLWAAAGVKRVAVVGGGGGDQITLLCSYLDPSASEPAS